MLWHDIPFQNCFLETKLLLLRSSFTQTWLVSCDILWDPFLSINLLSNTGFNVETVEYKNISFTVWDVGGQDKVWRLYALQLPFGNYACLATSFYSIVTDMSCWFFFPMDGFILLGVPLFRYEKYSIPSSVLSSSILF